MTYLHNAFTFLFNPIGKEGRLGWFLFGFFIPQLISLYLITHHFSIVTISIGVILLCAGICIYAKRFQDIGGSLGMSLFFAVITAPIVILTPGLMLFALTVDGSGIAKVLDGGLGFVFCIFFVILLFMPGKKEKIASTV